MIRERQREGITVAKKADVRKGRKPSLTVVRVAEIRKRVFVFTCPRGITQRLNRITCLSMRNLTSRRHASGALKTDLRPTWKRALGC
jgi:DNA invertase Pin-like site-specific DNA recombinase